MKKLSYLLILLLFAACDKGQLLDNLAPETDIFVKSINLTGENRLNTVVELHWYGEDQDGYITGYEISFDQVAWEFVEVQDSTFRFSINEGSDTTDIDFYVRALDDQSLADPTPAYLKIPIKNTAPIAKFDSLKLIPDTSIAVFSVTWEVNDLDGDDTVDSIFVKLNTGSWYPLESNVNFLTLLPSAPMQMGSQQARVYKGFEAQELSLAIDDLNLDGDNVMYLRAKDFAGSFSEIDTSNTFYLKTQSSDLLVIDDNNAAAGVLPEEVFLPILNTVYPQYDFLDLEANLPPFWDPTFDIFLGLYDKVFWYSNGSEQSAYGDQLFMEIASNQIQSFLNRGGKLLVSMKFPPAFNDPELGNNSTIFGFAPVDSISTSTGQARIPIGRLVNPMGDFANEFDTLECSTFITGADPFYPKNPANSLYDTEVLATGGWVGPSTVSGRTLFNNGQTNQIFFSIELHFLNGRPAALENLFDHILNEEFNW